MSAPLGPPGRRLRCDECGRRGHTARSHEPGGLLYVATAAAEPDLLTELAEVERTPAQLLVDAVESVRTSDQVLANRVMVTYDTAAGTFTEAGRRLTAQQLADAETAARRLDQVHRFITPAGEVKTISGPDATPERQQGLCADGAWTRDPATGRWYCAECARPAPGPVLAEIEALQDDAPGQLVEVDLPPLQPRSRWEIDGTGKTPENGDGRGRSAGVIVLDDPVEGASPDSAEPEDAQVAGVLLAVDPGPPEPGADCDCWGDGDWHPRGSGGCQSSLTDAEVAAAFGRPVEGEPRALVDPDADPAPEWRPPVAAAFVELAERSHMPGWPATPVETVAGPTAAVLLGAMAANERQIAHAFGVPPAMVNDPTRGDLAVQHGPSWAPWATWEGPDARPRITLPGVYELSDTEYHDPAVTGDWVSNSDLKAMTLPGAPAKWKFKRDNGIRDERDVFQFGKAAHRRVLGVGAEVVARPSMWQDWRKQAAKDWRAEQQAAGRVVVTPEEAEVIEEMAVAMLANAHAADLLSRPGRGEVALFWRELLPSGRWVQRRAMLDFLPDFGPIADYKTCVSAAPDDQMAREISRFRYHWQAATYIAAVVALDLPAAPDLVFLFQEKSAPYLVTPVNLDDPTMMAAEIQNQRALEVYVDCLESGVWPGYTDGTVTMSIPEYELREYEQEIK